MKEVHIQIQMATLYKLTCYSAMDANNDREALELQLSELEMLRSMYPTEKELYVRDPGDILDLRNYLSGVGSAQSLPKLEYVVSVNVNEVTTMITVGWKSVLSYCNI